MLWISFLIVDSSLMDCWWTKIFYNSIFCLNINAIFFSLFVFPVIWIVFVRFEFNKLSHSKNFFELSWRDADLNLMPEPMIYGPGLWVENDACQCNFWYGAEANAWGRADAGANTWAEHYYSLCYTETQGRIQPRLGSWWSPQSFSKWSRKWLQHLQNWFNFSLALGIQM